MKSSKTAEVRVEAGLMETWENKASVRMLLYAGFELLGRLMARNPEIPVILAFSKTTGVSLSDVLPPESDTWPSSEEEVDGDR